MVYNQIANLPDVLLFYSQETLKETPKDFIILISYIKQHQDYNLKIIFMLSTLKVEEQVFIINFKLRHCKFLANCFVKSHRCVSLYFLSGAQTLEIKA